MRGQPGPTVVQGYLPEADDGEKRIFWVDGHIVGGYLRKRAPGAFHHNLQRGGQPEATEISESDKKICDAIAPHLKRNGVAIAGLDIIGSALVECNTLNPGGVHYAESFRQHGAQTIASCCRSFGLSAISLTFTPWSHYRKSRLWQCPSRRFCCAISRLSWFCLGYLRGY